jgi:3'5'-cyclic nucleotide phosphodiesterase
MVHLVSGLLLQSYVSAIASMYRPNYFHNFEQPSHVIVSVTKLLSRIVAADFVGSPETDLHDHTYGIASDPLIQFACVFSALIHDVDHTGVPNTQLVKENPALGAYFKARSAAEQNSVELSWSLLMEDQFAALRRAIYQTEEEKLRFRQLVVNSVMATDIMDNELKALRDARWAQAFTGVTIGPEVSPKTVADRKATIVIEHLIQASDVSHTMQHWHVYRKWNERLFAETYQAFIQGRANRDPAEFWYQGEIGFFDHYIIPLAKKLKDCGVFGVSSDEYLNYALENRNEWERRGQTIVAEMLENRRTRRLTER